MIARITSLVTLFAVFSFVAPSDAVDVKFTQIYPNLEFSRPLALIVPPDGSGRRFLVEQTGLIRVLPSDESTSDTDVFADFTNHMSVEKDFEEGLLGLAFHPRFADNGKFYVSYSAQGPKRLVLSEFSVGDNGKANLKSERILMKIQQPEWNHNSGNIVFGPKDGFLYLSVGDGGLRDGVHLLAQRLQAWNGKVLRIDVDSKSPGREYGLPEDNPFIDNPIASPEIYALGLRNPWGSWIDPETGLFWLADVGQDFHEEVNLIERGGNYGWNYREAMHEFAGRVPLMQTLKRKDKGIEKLQFIDPIHEYPRTDGISITGGFVYRGKIDALKNHYIYGDWGTGRIWGLEYDTAAKKVSENIALRTPEQVAEGLIKPTGIYPDENGEAIILGWQGKLYRITE
ncbi:MAG: PQQ-dependent sugar dehydrogenase [Verrucomicrobiales bacterium]|nr:PQQ-dependent sugar dehydrogenase [Verrucomicrobiales bacterium]